MAEMSPAPLPLASLTRLGRLFYLILVAGLLLYTGLTLWLALAGAIYPFELDYGEGNVLWFARQAALGQPMYRPLLEYPLASNNYPPLPMLLVAPFLTVLGPVYGPGRLLNFGAALLVALWLYKIAQAETGEERWSRLAPLLFLGSTFIYHWVPLYRVDLIGLALAFTGVYSVWRTEVGPESRARRLYLAAAMVLFVMAVYCKQSFLAAPAAATAALWLRDRRLGVGFGLVFGALCAAVLLLGTLLTGGAFWAGLITSNVSAWLWSTFLPILTLWLRTYAVLIGIACWVWVSRIRRRQRPGVLEIYFPLSLLAIVLSGRVGAWENYYFEAVAMICLFTVFSFRRGKEARMSPSLVLMGLLIQLVLFLPEHDPRIALDLMASEGAANRTLRPELQRVSGPIAAEDMGALITAGQPVVYYSFIYSNLARSGQYDQKWELESLRNRTIPLVLLNQGTREDVDHYSRFSREFVSELDANYALSQVIGKYEMYRPAPLAHTASFDFEDKLDLVAWGREPEGSLDPGTRKLTYTLLWYARQDLKARYTAFVHLEDSQGRVIAQDDHEPHGSHFPTYTWRAGDKVREVHSLSWREPLAQGEYFLRLGWYDSITLDRLAVGSDDVVNLERLVVNR